VPLGFGDDCPGLNRDGLLAQCIVTEPKTCYRCGREFLPIGSNGRVCPLCRKPRVRTRRAPLDRHLSFREKQIAQLVFQAKQNKEIAFQLHLTEGTIKEYLNRIYHKLEMKNRTQLAVWVASGLNLTATKFMR